MYKDSCSDLQNSAVLPEKFPFHIIKSKINFDGLFCHFFQNRFKNSALYVKKPKETTNLSKIFLQPN